MSDDLDRLRPWIGKTEETSDLITAWPMAALSGTLDRDDPKPGKGMPVPAPWHWLYFLETAAQSSLAEDGHQGRGGFLPPVDLPRRMWAGGRMEFHLPLRIGDEAVKKSTIKDITLKNGRSGQLAFVVVRHEIFGPNGLTVAEEHDIVYREEAKPGDPAPKPLPAPAVAQWGRAIHPDPALLFRYSALTFNGHRIHYDIDYCRDQEGYPGLVVHGPLTATLLLDLVRRECPGREMAGFDYRATKPLFATGDYRVEGCLADDEKSAQVWALDEGGALCMSGTVPFK